MVVQGRWSQNRWNGCGLIEPDGSGWTKAVFISRTGVESGMGGAYQNLVGLGWIMTANVSGARVEDGMGGA